MSKNKSITQQIEELEKENSRLLELDKLFDKAIKNEFGIDRKTIHQLIQYYNDSARANAGDRRNF